MKKHLYIILIVLIAISTNYAQAVKKHIEPSKNKIEAKAEEKAIDVLSLDKNKNGKVFQCPMDWAVISDKAGNCNICGMKLKEYSVLQAKENLDKYLKASKKHNHKEMKEMNKNASLWNSVCPLEGGAVSIEAGTSEFKGKKIGFCCEDCKAEFDKKPEKYIQNLSKDGKKFLTKK